MMWIFSAMMFLSIYKLGKYVITDYFQEMDK